MALISVAPLSAICSPVNSSFRATSNTSSAVRPLASPSGMSFLALDIAFLTIGLGISSCPNSVPSISMSNPLGLYVGMFGMLRDV